MRSRGTTTRTAIAAAAAAAIAAGVAFGADSGANTPRAASTAEAKKIVKMKDARLKFEINATDRDGGVQAFIDADSWSEMSVFDPAGRRILRTKITGRMGKQGGTELFMESAEPDFKTLPLDQLLKRFPAGTYQFRGIGLKGERYVGQAALTHKIPAGPKLVSPVEGAAPQALNDTTIRWQPVEPAGGTSPIIGYQVLVVRPNTGIKALPKVILDVTMPPSATSMAVPPGFLHPSTEYEWEVLAIERSGNQTLSSSSFTTAAS